MVDEISSNAYWPISRNRMVLTQNFKHLISPEKPVFATRLTTQESAESVRPAAGRRKATYFRKQQVSRGVVIFVVCVALFVYMPLM
jgi:hypothetical protein